MAGRPRPDPPPRPVPRRPRRLPQPRRGPAVRQARSASASTAGSARASYKPREGDVVELTAPPPKVSQLLPEPIPIEVVYEDDHMMAINKQAGLIIHPARGVWTGTLVNGLLALRQAVVAGQRRPPAGDPAPARPQHDRHPADRQERRGALAPGPAVRAADDAEDLPRALPRRAAAQGRRDRPADRQGQPQAGAAGDRLREGRREGRRDRLRGRADDSGRCRTGSSGGVATTRTTRPTPPRRRGWRW